MAVHWALQHQETRGSHPPAPPPSLTSDGVPSGARHGAESSVSPFQPRGKGAEFRKEFLSLGAPLPAPCQAGQASLSVVTKKFSHTVKSLKIALWVWAIRKRNKAGSGWGLP